MFKPTKGNVYVTRLPVEEEKTASGIIVATQDLNEKAAHERVLIYAKVEAVGEGVDQVQVGDDCVFPRYEAWPLLAKKSKDDDEFIIAEKHIYATITA